MNTHAAPALLAALAHAALAAPAPVYSNGSADPAVPALGAAALTASGVPAPAGGAWSEVAGLGATESNAVAGFAAHPASAGDAHRFADDFAVTARFGLRIDAARLYAYQTGAGASPFAAVTLRVWSARPDQPGAAVLFGDAVTNRLTASTPTATFRVFNTLRPPFAGPPGTTREVHRLEASLGPAGLTLQPGVYWLDWQITPAVVGADAFVPPVTIPGQRAPANANALQLRQPAGQAAASWAALVDQGKPASAPDVAADLPFILIGERLPNPCPGDANGDNLVNFSDLNLVLADFGRTGPGLLGDVNGDDAVNFNDLNATLTAFGSGC